MVRLVFFFPVNVFVITLKSILQLELLFMEDGIQTSYTPTLVSFLAVSLWFELHFEVVVLKNFFIINNITTGEDKSLQIM